MIAWALRVCEVNKTPVWRVDSGEWREGTVLEERKRRGSRTGRGHAAATWAVKA